MGKRIDLPESDVQELIKRYSSGESVLSISKSSKYSYDVVRRVLVENGLSIRQNSFTAKKYKCDSSFFDSIDSEHKAYWLGFIYADGAIVKHEYGYKLSIALKEDDAQHLEKFREVLKSDAPIKKYKVKSFADYEGYSANLRLFETAMCEQLILKGATENKTNTLSFPDESIVPKHLIRHFIRGYFDGDGSITRVLNKQRNAIVYQLKILGTEDMLNGIHNAFEIPKPIKLYRRWKDSKANNFSIEYGGNRQAERLLDFLYKDATIYLDRKYELYQMLKHERANDPRVRKFKNK